tara:strand:- start:356 stop:478 length:123 start_codon:yes stop_codon:yes gene_type:complete
MEIDTDIRRAHRAVVNGSEEDDKSRYPSGLGFFHASVAVN